MRWSILYVIFRREVLDQLRDRRTLFMIFVFPILLYPILGYGILQVTAAMEKKPRLVVVVGAEHLPREQQQPLLNSERNGFNPRLFDSPQEASLLVAQCVPGDGPWASPETREQAVRSGLAAAVMVIPADLPDQFRNKNDVQIPIDYKSVDEPSQITYLRLREVLDRWKRGIVDERRKQDKLPQGYTQPIQVKGVDVATAQELEGNVWSRIFPFLLVIMSLTGAFYPAVDLCAGEKERGTMETLLISPATRAEIVLGKFLTVMLASVLTALLNLVSMGLTGIQMATGSGMGRMAAETGRHAAAATISPPTLQSAFWMIILLIPLSAFFSAICVALAVLARSMKEGQYYMTPLYLVCLPLILLTLMPEIELNLFYSLVPITGVALLLRALIMGDYQTAVRFFLPVMVPTVVYAAVALRWAIDQFEREEVLFREAERFNLAHWLKHLIRDRQPMPTGGQATLCFALILTASWFSVLFMARRGIGATIAGAAAGQFLILFPPLIMAVMLTSSPRRTLRSVLAGPALPGSGRRLRRGTQPHGQRAAAPCGALVPDLVGHQAIALRDDVSDTQHLGRGGGACLATGRLRGACFPRVHPLGSRIPPPHPLGDPAVGPHVRVSSRAHEPVSAALQCHTPGRRPGPACGSEPKFVAWHRISLLEQRARDHTGLVAALPRVGWSGVLALSHSGRGSLSWGLACIQRAGLCALVPLPLES